MTMGGADDAAQLAGHRRAYQLLRLLELRDSDGVDRLVTAPVSADEWVLLGLGLLSVAEITAGRLPDEQRPAAEVQVAELAELGYHISDSTQLTTWILLAAHLAIELLTLKDPDQGSRLAFYESRARMSYDLGDAGDR